MNYISAERFLSQDEKTKKVLLDWWQPQIGDLYNDNAFEDNRLLCIITKGKLEVIELDKYLSYYVPLLNEFQLRNFIQDSGYKYIGINNFIELDNKETWNIKVFKSMMQFEPDFEFVSNSPLECYWYIVLKIINEMEVIKNE